MKLKSSVNISSTILLLYALCVCCGVCLIFCCRELKRFSTNKFEVLTKDIGLVLEIPSIDLTDPMRHDIKDECHAVVKGNMKGMATLRQSKTFPWKDHTTDEQVFHIAKNCTDLRRRYRFPPFFNPNVTDEELNFPIAYTILAHKRVNQILILLSAIYRKHNIHCVHLDQKSPSTTYKALKKVAQCFPNIVLASERIKVYYAHVSRLEADIVCMKDMLQLQKPAVEWKYLINLCSQDFPIKTNLEMVKLLKELHGRNSIQGQLATDERTKRRTQFVHKLVRIGKKGNEKLVIGRTRRKLSPPPYNMTIVKNSAYNLYTREFLQWALLDSNAGPALLKWSQDTYTPDEHFWLMMNLQTDAPGGSNTPSVPLARGVRWMTVRQNECHGQKIHGICVFGAEDIWKVIRQKRLLLNKFDISHDSSGPICIRRLLDERSTASNPYNS